MLEKTADDIDRASMQEAAFTVASIKDIQKNLEAQKHPDFLTPFCLDCGVTIPAKRLEAGRIRCTDCETLIEAESKLFRRKK